MISKLKPKSEFTRNVLTLMTGTTIAQAIPIAISPILTRIYTPEDFGVFALYMSLLMIFGNLAAGRYEMAILLPKNNRDAKHIVVVAIILSFITSLIFFFLIVLFHKEIMGVLENNNISIWLYLLPLNIFLFSVASILYYWYNRKKEYKTLAHNQILKSSMQGIVNISVGYFSKITAGLISGTLLGTFISVIYLFKKVKNDFDKFIFSKYRAILLLKKYQKFPKFLILSNFLESLSNQLPILLISSFFGITIVGFYALSQRIVKIPLMFMGSSISSVFRQKASELLVTTGSCRVLYLNTFKKLFILGTIPFIIFYFIAPDMFRVIFGEEWKVTGEYAQLLTPLFYLEFIIYPLRIMFIVAEQQAYTVYIQIYAIISVFIAFAVGNYYFHSIEASLVILTILYAIKNIYELVMSYRFTVKEVL